MFKGFNRTLSILVGLVVLVAFTVSGMFIYQNFFSKKDTTETQIKFDKVSVIEKIRRQARIQTTKETYQRNVTVTLQKDNLVILDVTLFESFRSQEVFVVGDVIAGTDLSKIDENNLTIDEQTNSISIKLPQAEILAVQISDDRTKILKEDITALFRLQNLIAGNETENNQKIFQEVNAQAKFGLVQSACENDILDRANTGTKEFLEEFLKDLKYRSINIEFTGQQNCSFEPEI